MTHDQGQQNRPARDTRIPAHVLTGFLGSGKTTLLRHMLAQESLADTAVVINEFGEVGLDHLLVRELAEDVVLLSSGCICCLVGDDLASTLSDLYAMMRTEDIPAFSRLVIETTGMADPAPIMQSIMGDQRVTPHYRLGQVLSTIDAVNGQHTLSDHAEARQQLAAADHVILTKTDLVSDIEQSLFMDTITARNPSAQVLTSGVNAFPVIDLLDTSGPAWTNPGNTRRTPTQEHQHNDEHDHQHTADSAHDVHTFTLMLDAALDWDQFVSWLEMLLMSRGHSILRVKGILNVKGRQDPVVVQGVQHVLYPLEALPGQSIDHSWIVFIVKDITRDAIESSLQDALTL